MTLPLGAERTSQLVEEPRVVQLTASGVNLVVELPANSLPRIVHWGADTGAADAVGLSTFARISRAPLATNGIDGGVPLAVLPEGWAGWTGTPGLTGHRSGAAWSPKFVPLEIDVVESRGEGGSIEVTADDVDAGLGLRLSIGLLPSGLISLRARVTNQAESPYDLDAITLALPVPTAADEVLDLAGRWAKERVPQRRPFTVGTHLREGRHGRTGADAATVLVAGETGFGFDHGRVWGVHLAFSGNHRVLAERIFAGDRLLGGGELLLPGEVSLAPGETYETPVLFASYGSGLDELAARFHDHLRARPRHPHSPRPVMLNVWEAVYFDHDLARILPLVDLAAQVGVERFVLDDGWFGDRRDETAGLGDWAVSDAVWGDGRLHELVTAVADRGMQFGLWFEPEMINTDSDLARAHPEWIMQVPGRLPVESRHQQVLDLTHPDAFTYLRDSIVGLVHEYGIDFIKWDHNRDLIDAGSTRTGRAGVHEQTLAVYRLLDQIRDACPALEIESCSSGGARVDLGILEHTDRVWGSDTIDAHERQQVQQWTSQLLPPELVGSHIGADRAHTTGRRLDLSFRAATAVFGHLGIEWDLTEATPQELAELAEWITFYKDQRALIHSGRVIRRTLEDGDLWLTGAVAPDRREGLYLVTLRERHITWPIGQVRLPGLDPALEYRVRPAGPEHAHAAFNPRVHPEWWRDGAVVSGAVLIEVGVQIPALNPDRVALIHVEVER